MTVKDTKNNLLKLNTDYTVTYAAGQKNAGTYKVVCKIKYNDTITIPDSIISKVIEPGVFLGTRLGPIFFTENILTFSFFRYIL